MSGQAYPGQKKIATELLMMRARPLPQGDCSLIAHELTRMGHPHPDDLLRARPLECVWKLSHVPQTLAPVFTAWLQQQSGDFWCYSTAGTASDTVDLLLGTSPMLVAALK